VNFNSTYPGKLF